MANSIISIIVSWSVRNQWSPQQPEINETHATFSFRDLAAMEDYNRSRSYGNGVTGMESYHPPPRQPTSYDLRSYSASYAQTQMGMANNHNPGSINNDFELKKGKSTSGSSSSSSSSFKSWSISDPEFQRKKRVASYKMYSVEGKVKGSLRRSFRWLKDRYTQVVYGWW